ncbi:hypothetical protein Bbelb_431690 [Branchiostoma belcheri]|nr:hypothetical protein Bbelb_431690 [Branchiostoma belcheri]
MFIVSKGPADSTDDWRRDDSATFWKSAEVHHRAKRNSEAKTVLILGKRSDLGCLSGSPATDGPRQVTTPAAPTAPPAESGTPPSIYCQDPVILTGDSGNITSPGYPDMYNDNLRCSWTITVSRGRAAIRFTSIDIEGHSMCAYDYLTVHDGANSSGTQLGKFCGKTIPPPVVASGKTRHLVFISDSSVNGQGFSIEYVGVTNLARGRNTSQSSTGYGLTSSLAVDGNTNGILWSMSCTHTINEQSNPWWRVDLGSTRTIFTVDVYDRVDECCSDRLNPFYVHVGHSTSVASNPSCDGEQSISGDYKSVPCNGLQGRYVGVALQGTSRTLTLCEVKVFAFSVTAAENMRTEQQSVGASIFKG